MVSLALLAYMMVDFGRFLLYWAGSAHAFRHNRPAEPGDPDVFQWHLVVPCRDEDAVITATLDGLRASTPRAHLWVVDDDSDDRTRELVLEAAARDPRIHLVQRRRTGSVGLGGNGQFVRLTALDELGRGTGAPWPERALLEDYESGLELRLAGYRLTHVHETRVSQEGLVSVRRFLTQRTRWAQGNMQRLRYNPRVLRSPHYTLAGKAEVLYTFLQPVVCVLLVLLTPVSLGISLATRICYPQDAAVFEQRFGLLMLIAFVIAALPLVRWGAVYRTSVRPERSRRTGLLWGLLLWLYTYHLFVVAVRAAVRLLLGRNGWAKTRRNAELTAVGAPTALEA
ncbi:hypothetical protein UK12_28450 [Saccharothrix sp. ST-888]|nr:hypothetical protein UK12_28450 [Saccharothrix sp. ST-888]